MKSAEVMLSMGKFKKSDQVSAGMDNTKPCIRQVVWVNYSGLKNPSILINPHLLVRPFSIELCVV